MTVRTDAGLLAGVSAGESAVTVFKGIPYAAPPTGPLRWRAPQPAPHWEGVRNADYFSARCPQSQPANGAVQAMSEDCLYLNVWTAGVAGKSPRPVFVWIYGGAFSGGTGADPQFDGANLAKKGVVVVTFNYRLGALGFLATPELSRESGHHASGDYGLLDDIAVLKWVRANIAGFGGDPHNVTVGGQSAGAGSTGFLSISPLAKGLFQHSIAESHARYPRDLELRFLSVSYRTKHVAERQGLEFAHKHNASTLRDLRALPWQELLVDNEFDADIHTGSTARPPLFRPVVDGWVVPYNYSETFNKGTQNDVAFVAGNNLDETGAVPETAFAKLRANAEGPPRLAGAPPAHVTLKDYLAYASGKFGSMTDEFLRLYPASSDDEAANASNSAARDNSRISTYLWGREWSRHAKQPIYTYFWTHRPPGPGSEMRGAFHGSEISYVFNNPGPAWTDDDRKIADTMSSYWVNFMTSGDPNGDGLARWTAYNPDVAQVMDLGTTFSPMPVAEPAKLAFWKKFFERQDAW